jgi:GPH family glycoside/pentoside/hexuronide:cation symporter
MTTPSSSQKIPFLTKLAFGAGDLGPAMVTAISGFFLLNFLINVAGLDPGPAGTLLLIVKIWDSINDPIVGWLTDKTKSGMGRRRPWLLYGAIPFGIFFFLHWIVPPIDVSLKFWYYLTIALLLDTAFTAINVPYTALTAELTQDYDERTSLNSFRFSFSILGGVISAFVHSQIINAFQKDPLTGYALSVAIWAVVSVLGVLAVFFGVKEKGTGAAEEGGPGFFKGLVIAFSNRAFILVTVIYLFSWLTIQFVQNNLFIYTRDWVGIDAGQFGFLLLGVQVSAFVWVLIWARVSERIGKKNVYYLGGVIFMIVLIGLFFVQPGQVPLVFVFGVVAGAGLGVGYLVPWSMLPDVIELDELQTGQRREGVFYGFFVLLQKFGLSLGLFISGWVLDWAGYIKSVPGQPDAVQPESVLFALRVLVGPAGAVILLLSFVAVYLYPITKEKHAEIRAALDARKAQG